MFKVGSIVADLELRKQKWDNSIRSIKADEDSLKGFAMRNSQAFTQMGMAMTLAGAAIVGSVGLMVKAYSDFDQALTESTAIMGDVSETTKEQMAEIATIISTQTVFSAKELAAAYFFLASAGMDANQSMQVLGDVAKFAQSGTFDLATATDLLTDAQTALGLSSKDAIKNQRNLIRVSDVLVGANTLANASVQQFAEALTNKAAAALVNVNVEMEEGVAVLAAYADKGIKGTLAGQRLTMMMNGLFDATSKNKDAWDAAGISLFNADGSMRSMADIVQDLEGHLGAMSVEQRTAELAMLGFNLKTKDSILTLLGSSEKIRQWTEDLKDMGGITDEVSRKQLETLNNKMKLLKNNITASAIQIGQSLAPALEDLVGSLTKVAQGVADWIKENPGLTKTIVKITTGVGAFLVVMGPLVMMLPKIAAGMGLVKAAAKGMGSSFKGMNAPLAGLKGTLGKLPAIGMAAFAGWQIGRLIAETTGLGDAITDLLSKKLPEMKQEVMDNNQAMFHLKTTYDLTRTELTALSEKFGDYSTALIAVNEKQQTGIEKIDEYKEAQQEGIPVGEAYSGGVKKLGEVSEEAAEKAEALKEQLISTQEALAEVNKGFMDSIATGTEFGGTLADVVGGGLAKVIGEAETLTDDALPELKTEFGDFSTEVVEDTEEIESVWSQMADGIQTKMASTWSDVLSGSTTLEKGLSGIFGAIKQNFFDIVGSMLAKFTTGFIMNILTGKGGIGSLVKGITGAFGKIGSAITGSATGEGTGGVFGKLTGSFLGGIAKMAGPIGIGLMVGKIIGWKNITKTVQDVWKGASKIVVGVISGIGDVLGAVSNNMKAAIEGVGEVMKSVFGAAGDIVGGIGGLIGGLMSGIGKLVGGGGESGNVGKDIKDTRNFLNEIRDIMYNAFLNNSNAMLVKMDNLNANIAHIKDRQIPSIQSVFGAMQSSLSGIWTTLGHIRQNTSESGATSALGTIANINRDIRKYTNQTVKAINNIGGAAHGGFFKQATLAVVGEAGPELVLPMDRQAPIVLDTIRGGQVGPGGGGKTYVFNFNSELVRIDSPGVSRSDLEAAGEDLYQIVKEQTQRFGD